MTSEIEYKKDQVTPVSKLMSLPSAMDQRLFAAACTGDIKALHQLFQENPFVLADYTVTTPYENPLNIAIKAGQLHFVQEIIKLKPELAKQSSQDGLRPLDVASAYGYLEIVRALLAASDLEICRLPGRDGKTAIHYAAINGRAEIIDALLAACPDSVEDVTAFGETAIHLAVKYFKFEAFRRFLEWLEMIGMKQQVNWKDKEGNTVLHCAVSRKQLEIVELMLHKDNPISDAIEVNALNARGLTAMDMLDIVMESSSDVHLRKILQSAGGQGASYVHDVSQTQPSEAVTNVKQSEHAKITEKKPKTWMDYFRFQKERDPPQEARNALLVVAALIVAATFEAGINPPSYIFEGPSMNRTTTPSQSNTTGSWNSNSTSSDELQQGGINILVSLTVFLVANSISLSTAFSIIEHLTKGLPFQRELRVSVFFMMFAYGWSLGNTKPTGTVKTICLVVALAAPTFLRQNLLCLLGMGRGCGS